MTEIHIFDFDGTLFKSPHPPKGWTDGWWANTRSLAPPCVPEKVSSDWWNRPVANELRESMRRPDVVTIVMTGRLERFRKRISKLLSSAGLAPDELMLSPGGMATSQYKKQHMRWLFSQFPATRAVHFWEDRHDHLKEFEKYALKQGYNFVPHPVKNVSNPPACGPSLDESMSDVVGRIEAMHQ